MAQFKDLGAPFLIRIMGHMWAFLDLLAFTQICKATRGAFKDNEALIMCNFLRRFYGINLYDAVHLVDYLPFFDEHWDYRSNPSQAGGDIGESIWSRKAREFSPGFLTASHVQRDRFVAAWIAGQYNQAIAVRLGRLSTRLDEFLGQYWEFVQHVVRDQVPTLCGPKSAGLPAAMSGRAAAFEDPPSPAERHRLLRASLRYEAMCRLFSLPYWRILVRVAWTGMDFAGKTAVLEGYAHHGFTSDQLLRLLDKDEAEQVLSVAAFVRAQWRAMLMELRNNFEVNAHTRCDRFAARGQEDDDEEDVLPLGEHLSVPIRVQENPVYSMEYLLGRSARGDNIWIDNLGCGFGIGLLRKFLRVRPVNQRKGLRSFMAACDSEAPTLDRASGYRPDFIHTRSFPILAPDDDTEVYDKAKMRLVGYHLWDSGRIETPEMQRLQEWLAAPSVPPFEPGSEDQNTPWPSFTSMELPFADYHKLAAHAWVEKFSDLGAPSPQRYHRILGILKQGRILNVLDMPLEDDAAPTA